MSAKSLAIVVFPLLHRIAAMLLGILFGVGASDGVAAYVRCDPERGIDDGAHGRRRGWFEARGRQNPHFGGLRGLSMAIIRCEPHRRAGGQARQHTRAALAARLVGYEWRSSVEADHSVCVPNSCRHPLLLFVAVGPLGALGDNVVVWFRYQSGEQVLPTFISLL